MNRYSRLSIEKFICLALQSTIKVIDNHTLGYSLPRFSGYPTDTLRYVEPLIFKDARTGRYAVFYEDDHGRITHLNLSGTIPANFEKVPWYAALPVHLTLIMLFLLVFLHFSIGWPLRRWIRRLRKKDPSGSIPYRGVRAAMVLCSSGALLFLIGLALVLVIKGQYLAISIPRGLTAILVLPFLTLPAFLYMMVAGTVKWRTSGWTMSGRMQYLTLCTIMLMYFWFLNYWNLIGFNY